MFHIRYETPAEIATTHINEYLSRWGVGVGEGDGT